MNSKLQSDILSLLIKENGRMVLDELEIIYIPPFWEGPFPGLTPKEFDENIRLMKEKNLIKVFETEDGTILVQLTRAGYELPRTVKQKVSSFLLHEKHNLYSLISALVSIAALIVSIISFSN